MRISYVVFPVPLLFFLIILGNSMTDSVYADTGIYTGDVNNQTTIQNSVNTNILSIHCGCTPTPSPSTLSPTPTVAEATPTPTLGQGSSATPTPGSFSGSSSGSSSSSSSGVAGPSSGPSQTVLNASTMAPTGTFAQTMMNYLLLAGWVIIAFGVSSYIHDKS